MSFLIAFLIAFDNLKKGRELGLARFDFGSDMVQQFDEFTVLSKVEGQVDHLFEPEPSFDTEPSLDPETSGPKGRTKCRAEGLSKVEGNPTPTIRQFNGSKSLEV